MAIPTSSTSCISFFPEESFAVSTSVHHSFRVHYQFVSVSVRMVLKHHQLQQRTNLPFPTFSPTLDSDTVFPLASFKSLTAPSRPRSWPATSLPTQKLCSLMLLDLAVFPIPISSFPCSYDLIHCYQQLQISLRTPDLYFAFPP